MKSRVNFIIFLLFFLVFIKLESSQLESSQFDIFNTQLSPIENVFSTENSKIAKKIVAVAIIGSGPAGLSAGLYMGRSKIPTVIFAGDLPGGQLMLTGDVENWPGVARQRGSEIISILESQAVHSGTHIIKETITKADFKSWPFILTLSNDDEVYALSVIIATGSNPRKILVPGEEEYWGKGVSSCAVCDCTFFKDKDVIVVGGGDSAVESALQLSGYAKNITIVVRKNFMRAAPVMQDKLKEYKNITILYNKRVKRIRGDGNQVTAIELENSMTSNAETISIDGVFLAIGHDPNTEIFKSTIKLDQAGYIDVDKKTKETSREGIFAAGDVEDYDFRQAVVAGSSGCQAHFGVVSFLRSIGWSEKFNGQCYWNTL